MRSVHIYLVYFIIWGTGFKYLCWRVKPKTSNVDSHPLSKYCYESEEIFCGDLPSLPAEIFSNLRFLRRFEFFSYHSVPPNIFL